MRALPWAILFLATVCALGGHASYFGRLSPGSTRSSDR